MAPRPSLALAVFLMFTCLSSRTALADACDTPPPPRYQPGQVDNYPNGADVITCTKPGPGREVWRIDYPSVDRSLTDYPAITFKRGDVVALSASGCVQSGGFWTNTWKRYVNPDDGDGHLDTLYYGTVQIVGITGNNNPQSIKHWIGPAFAIPTDGHLALGYVDDDLSDNGYWNHDDGLNDQCVGLDKVVVEIEINRGAASEYEDCSKWTNFTHNPVAPSVPELARVADLLRTEAEVPFGLPITHDAHAQAITHFQIFQDGKRDSNTTLSNRPKNSAEMHANRCLYYAYTPTMSPTWYPADLAFDKSPQKDWQARPWDASLANVSFSMLEDSNRDAKQWRPTFLPGYCGGAGTSWRSSAPRWIEVCAPRDRPVNDWTATTLTGFPEREPMSAEIEHSGAICNWHMKNISLSDACTDASREEWTVVTSHDFRSVEGLVTNAFLSGDDFARDHNEMPDGHYVGVHTDIETHNDAVDNCAFLEANDGEHCVDWEMNVLPDANYRHLLARNESTLNDRPGGDCKSKHPTYYRLGNDYEELLGAVGIEGEQWYYPVGYRPEAGDRAVMRGMWIVDCGHPDWHGELHPASLLQSSYLQTNDYAPVLGATWNRPLRLTSKWRAITNGEPAVVTKIVASPVFAEDKLEVDVWPPARPCAGARFHVEREDLRPNSRWRGVQFTETLLPADGNPNHLHLTITRASPYALNFGGDGDVTNPDSKLTFFTAYMAWWSHDQESCPSRDKD